MTTTGSTPQTPSLADEVRNTKPEIIDIHKLEECHRDDDDDEFTLDNVINSSHVQDCFACLTKLQHMIQAHRAKLVVKDLVRRAKRVRAAGINHICSLKAARFSSDDIEYHGVEDCATPSIHMKDGSLMESTAKALRAAGFTVTHDQNDPSNLIASW